MTLRRPLIMLGLMTLATLLLAAAHPANAAPACNGKPATIFRGDGNNTIHGTSGRSEPLRNCKWRADVAAPDVYDAGRRGAPVPVHAVVVGE